MDFYNLVEPDIRMVEKKMEELIPKEPKEVYGMLFPFIKRGGKRIRPALTILCCAATGGKKESAYVPAALIEMFHNFTLIHDDIQDNSLLRRGKPALHIEYGPPIAINSGNALYTTVWKKLVTLDLENKKKQIILESCADAFKRVVDGQGIELSWYKNNTFSISEESYIDMVSGKTAALIGLSCKVGAILSDSDPRTIEELYNFGCKIGLAFQIYDDILNLVGDVSKYKKEIGGDIQEGKRSLMVIDLLKKLDSGDSKRVVGILSKHKKTNKDITRLISLIKENGCIEHAMKKAEDFVFEAKACLEGLPESEEKKALNNIADFVINRES